jgi:TPR repeat protein
MKSKIQKQLLYVHIIKHAYIWFFVWLALACLAMALWTPVFGETLEELEAYACFGDDPEAQYQFALLLEKGESTEKDLEQAIDNLDRAANSGHINAKEKLNLILNQLKNNALENDLNAQFLLGVSLYHGRGVDQNRKEGVDWLSKAAQKGNSDAQYYLGEIFCSSPSFKDANFHDPKKGIELLKKSAASENIGAIYRLFNLYIHGKHVKQNHFEALSLVKNGVKLNNSGAINTLGTMYYYGIGVARDLKKALGYWHKSAELGNQEAKVFLGAGYNPKIWEGSFPRPPSWGIAYSIGYDIISNPDIRVRDPQEAVKWLKEASKKFYKTGWEDDCENAIGNAYFRGEGVDIEYKEAIKWWEKASVKRPGQEVGNTDALYNLGMAYKSGHGVKPDMAKAIQYFEMSASWNDSNSARELLEIYNQQTKSPQEFLAKAKSVDIWDEIIWEFLEKKSKKFTKVKEVGFSLGEVFDHLAETNRSIDDVSKSIDLAEKLEEEMDVFRLELNQIQKKEAVDKISSTTFPAKLALLIANSNYSKFGGLANTDSDAQKLAKVLNYLGFQVSILKNASKEQMLDALKDFEAKVRGTNAIAFFHYGGHGVQVEGKNYLIPADAEIPDERRVSTRAVDLDEVIAVLDSAKPKASVLVVDACRHNPLPANATRSATRGLAVVGRKPKNSVIIYAAEAGNEAFDGLFTPILAENLQEHSDKSLNQIMQKVRAEVFERSKGAQTPGEYNQLFEELFLLNKN